MEFKTYTFPQTFQGFSTGGSRAKDMLFAKDILFAIEAVGTGIGFLERATFTTGKRDFWIMHIKSGTVFRLPSLENEEEAQQLVELVGALPDWRRDKARKQETIADEAKALGALLLLIKRGFRLIPFKDSSALPKDILPSLVFEEVKLLLKSLSEYASIWAYREIPFDYSKTELDQHMGFKEMEFIGGIYLPHSHLWLRYFDGKIGMSPAYGSPDDQARKDMWFVEMNEYGYVESLEITRYACQDEH
jgi:hypothetical protein